MPDTLIRTVAVSKRYGAVTALDRVGIDIADGLVTAIVGDNGSGKSTLISILSGNVRPDAGTIEAFGTSYRHLSVRGALKLGIHTVYQDLSLDNNKNAFENIYLGGELMRGPFLDRRAMRRQARELLDQLEIHLPDLDEPVGNLSGGQRQGIAIARALRASGRVLLLDEPTAAMGVRESRNTLDLMRRLRGQGMAQVLVCHNLYQVFDIADVAFVMRAGRCIASVEVAQSSPEALHDLILSREHEGVAL